MYSPLQLTSKYLKYYFTASNGKGHGVHSPFVFDFIIHVLNDKAAYPCYVTVEHKRKELMNENRIIQVEDYGAGSTKLKSPQRKVSNIVKTSVKHKKWGQLLFRICKHYQVKNVIELGTSLGVTTSYLANAAEQVFSIEGSPQVASIAKEVIASQQLSNVQVFTGTFKEQLPEVLQQAGKIDLAFIDGHHLQKPTLEYFNQIIPFIHNDSVIIFDDIHWSAGMESAWGAVKANPAVTLSVDLFFIGLVFFNSNFKEKQHFSVRF